MDELVVHERNYPPCKAAGGFAAMRLERLTLHRTPKSLVASDHLPLVADFGWDVTSP